MDQLPNCCLYVVMKKVVVKRKIEFMKLDEKCIDAILKWLPMDDLYSVSRTCRALQRLAGQRFERDYPNALLTVELMEDKRIQSQYEEKFDLYFSVNIRNVIISSYRFDDDPTTLFIYIKHNCCQNLKALTLDRLCCKPYIDYGIVIKTQLENLESIAFNRCAIDDIHVQFLRHCHQLRHLRIKKKGYNVEYGTSWIHYAYPKLDSFTIWGGNNDDYTNLKFFFKVNRNVKNINCMGINVLEVILENVHDLHNLVIHCEWPEELDEILSLLLKHRKRNVFRHFEMIFSFTCSLDCLPQNLDCIKSFISIPKFLSKFQGFHGLFATDTILVDSILKKLKNLRTLSLKLALEDESKAYELAMALPMLDDIRLYIAFSRICFGKTFKTLTMPFLATSKQLKRLCVNFTGNVGVTHANDIIHLSNARSLVKGACKTTIYLNSDVIHKSKFIVPMDGPIQIKPSSQLSRQIYLDPFLF